VGAYHVGLDPAAYSQGNLVVLPASAADEFLRFCQRNPKPCPLIAVSEPGESRIASLGEDVDLRTDLPCYRTNVMCEPAGQFSGPLVVSVRPMNAADASRDRGSKNNSPLPSEAQVESPPPADRASRPVRSAR
jgi:uncharacterized protein YcsI (UPF0317 family)